MNIRAICRGVKAVFNQPSSPPVPRLDDISQRMSERLGENVTLQVHTKLTVRLLRQLIRIDKQSFIKEQQYSYFYFWVFCSGKTDLRIITLNDQKGAYVGFCIGYRENFGPADRYFFDSLAFEKQYRHRGIAKLLTPALSMVKEMGYKSVYIYCADKSVDGTDLVKFYTKLGFVWVDYKEETGHKMVLVLD